MTGNVQPVTFYVPPSAGEPVEVKVTHSGLRMVLVNRESVRRLVVDLDIKGIGVNAKPRGDAVARHGRDLHRAACLRGDVELRNADEKVVAVRFDPRTVALRARAPAGSACGLARGSRSVPCCA